MKCDDGYKFGLTVEYNGQEENLIAKFYIEGNAMVVAGHVMDSLRASPIIRVVDLEDEICIGAFQKEVKRLDCKTAVFG